MGYSTSKKAIRRVEPYLQQMVNAEGLIQFPAAEPSEFAYQLREAIHSAAFHALDAARNAVEPYASYARLKSKYLIRVKGPLVICESRDFVPVAKLSDSLAQLSIPDVSETLAVLGACIKHKAPMMVFPDANEGTVDVSALMRWADGNGYEVIAADNHVTVKQR